ncbi:MAG TPA: hypothetical protein VN656_07040 [Stellaceae bacterium]|nr:hypothetical protein [Stellaceae bacterium]
MTSGHRFQFRLFGALAASSLLLLSACATGPDWRAISQQAAQIHATCESQHTDSALATEQCANSQISNLYASAGFPDMDVLDAYLTKREAIAAQKDRHAISAEDARAEFAQALAEENTMLQQRAASRAQLAASTRPFFCDRLGFHSMVCY